MILLVKVFVRKNNVEQAIRVLRKKIQKEGILKRVRQTRYFESPSEKRIRKEKEGRKNFLKKKKETGEIRSFINSFESLKRGHCDLSFLGLGLYYNFITITI